MLAHPRQFAAPFDVADIAADQPQKRCRQNRRGADRSDGRIKGSRAVENTREALVAVMEFGGGDALKFASSKILKRRNKTTIARAEQ